MRIQVPSHTRFSGRKTKVNRHNSGDKDTNNNLDNTRMSQKTTRTEPVESMGRVKPQVQNSLFLL